MNLPALEVRHCARPDADYLYVRNLYETRRMQYTLMNMAGTDPNTSVNGKLRYGSKGTPYVRISLSIPGNVTPWFFWPWRESEIAKPFNGIPGSYALQALDVYRNGVFMHTEYQIYVA